MKFSIIFKTVLFSVFTFIATTTYAANTTNPTTSNETIQFDKEDGGGSIIVVSGRMAEVTDERSRVGADSDYTMTVKVIKAGTVLIEKTTNEPQISLDLSELDAGFYMLVVETPNGEDKEVITLN